MRCVNCPALFTDGFEYPESYCAIYSEDECIDFNDESCGCRHKKSTIEKRLKELNYVKDKEYEEFAKTYIDACEIEESMKNAVLYACKECNISLAYDMFESLHKIDLNDSLFHDFIFRIIESFDSSNFEIVRKSNGK